MERKYKILDHDTKLLNGRLLRRIKAVRSFSDVSEGDLGGYIECERNLSHEGDCWVYDNKSEDQFACVCECAEVSDNATIRSRAHISGYAKIKDNACIGGTSKIHDDAIVEHNALVTDNFEVFGKAKIGGCIKLRSKKNNNGNIKSGKVCGNVVLNGNDVYKTADFIDDSYFQNDKDDGKDIFIEDISNNEETQEPEKIITTNTLPFSYSVLHQETQETKKENKFVLVEDDVCYIENEQGESINLYRIRASRDFSDIKKGTLGGYIEKESNLSQDGNSWVYGNATIYGTSKINDNALIYDNVCICNSIISDSVNIKEHAFVFGTTITGNVVITGSPIITHCTIQDNVTICGRPFIDKCCLYDNVEIEGTSVLENRVNLYNYVKVMSNAQIKCKVVLGDYIVVSTNAVIEGDGITELCMRGNFTIKGITTTRWMLPNKRKFLDL